MELEFGSVGFEGRGKPEYPEKTSRSKGENQHQKGKQGWRSGDSTRLPPMWPGFNSRRRRHMWVEFVVCC